MLSTGRMIASNSPFLSCLTLPHAFSFVMFLSIAMFLMRCLKHGIELDGATVGASLSVFLFQSKSSSPLNRLGHAGAPLVKQPTLQLSTFCRRSSAWTILSSVYSLEIPGKFGGREMKQIYHSPCNSSDSWVSNFQLSGWSCFRY